jgi:hypothetical protein
MPNLIRDEAGEESIGVLRLVEGLQIREMRIFKRVIRPEKEKEL